MSFFKESEGLNIKDGVLLGIGENTDQEIYLPTGVKEIAKNAFKGGGKFTSIILNNDLEIIHEGAFQDNAQLKQAFFFSRNLKRIEKDAFKGCPLRFVEFKSSTKKVWVSKDAFDLENVDTFGGRYELESMKEIDGVFFDYYQKVLLGCRVEKSDEEYRVPSSVISINGQAFYSTRIKHIYLNEGLKRIGHNAFAYSFVEKIEIPSTLEYIGGYAFKCTNIEVIYFPKSIKEFGDEIFKGDFDFGEHSKIKLVVLEGKESEWKNRIKPLLDHDDYFKIKYTK